MALVDDQEVDMGEVEERVSPVEQVKEDLVHHHKDLVLVQRLLPVVEGPVVDVVGPAEAHARQRGVAGDELGLLVNQCHGVDQKYCPFAVAEKKGKYLVLPLTGNDSPLGCRKGLGHPMKLAIS